VAVSDVWCDGVPTPELGEGVVQRLCRDCAASWCGFPCDPCPWCFAAAERQLAEQRRLLLFPPFRYDQHGPRYDELDDVDKRIWDRTRGKVSKGTHAPTVRFAPVEASSGNGPHEDRFGTDSVREWARRLGRAVEAGLVTDVEADAALARVSAAARSNTLVLDRAARRG
jgi:hypothetical protein